MKLKSLLAALGLAIAGAAHAAVPVTATTDLGVLTGTLTGFGNTFEQSVPNFIDYYTFTLDSTDELNVLGLTFTLDFRNLLDVDLTSASLTGGGLSSALTDTNPNDGFSFTSLAAGSYTLALAGSAPGSLGGVYAGAIHAAPVPEPEHYAMMLTGLLMVGWRVRRRNAR